MADQPTYSQGAHPAPLPAAWYLPAVTRLQQQLQREKVSYWLLLVITAIATAPLGFWMGLLISLAFPVLQESMESSFALPQWLINLLTPLGVASSLFGSLLTMAGGVVLPALIIVWAVLAQSRQLSFATRDILYGQAALMLIDDQYARLIAEEREQHFHIKINQVDPGNTFLDRVNFFAHHYLQFRQLAYGPCTPRIPSIVGRNCWLEGILSCLGGCLNACAGFGILLTVPLLVRVVVTWSRHLAIKQAILDYLIGRHDGVLEQLASAEGRSSGEQTGA